MERPENRKLKPTAFFSVAIVVLEGSLGVTKYDRIRLRPVVTQTASARQLEIPELRDDTGEL